MLYFFLVKIHCAIPIVNPILIYGAILFRTFFLEAILSTIWDDFVDANWDINWDSNWDDNCDLN